MQGELMAVDHQPILLTDGMVHLTVQSKMGQIDDRAAVFANKVAMGGDNGVKTLLSLNDSYAPNIASLLKEDEIAVHGAQAQVGMAGVSTAGRSTRRRDGSWCPEWRPGWPLSFYCIEWTVPYPPP